jgi:aspartyl-tRNA synthetase
MSMHFQQRTILCGQLRPEHVGSSIVLNGWVNARRDYGGIIFIDLRDREGIAQVVIDSSYTPDLGASIHEVRSEYVLWVKGTVRMRENPNPRIPTGLVEVLVDEVGNATPVLLAHFVHGLDVEHGLQTLSQAG